jgi:ribonuclease-3
MAARSESNRQELLALQQRMGLTLCDSALLRRALTHASYLNENPECAWSDNERLEFLGDAVADFLAAEYLYDRFPQWQEGRLTSLRAELVRSETLARFAVEIDLGSSLLLGRGEELGGGRSRPAMLGDAFEALLGALYLDQGIDTVHGFLLPFFRSYVESLAGSGLVRDAKSQLQEWSQAEFHEPPTYVTVQETGPDHAKQFEVEVWILGQVRGRGSGSSKQAAEQAAARAALDAMPKQPGGGAATNS